MPVRAEYVVSRLLEDEPPPEEIDPKAYVMSGYADYHPIHLLTTREVRAWWLKHYGAPVKSIYKDIFGQMHGYALDREGIINTKAISDSEWNITAALTTWLRQVVRNGDRIQAHIHYYELAPHEPPGNARIFFDLWRDDWKELRYKRR